MATVTVHGDATGFKQQMTAGIHRLGADEPIADGGTDTGPSPYDLLAGRARRLNVDDDRAVRATQAVAAPGRQRHAQPLEDPRHRLRRVRDEGGQARPDRDRDHADGALSPEQREQLLVIAQKCPVHRTLTSEINIRTRLV